MSNSTEPTESISLDKLASQAIVPGCSIVLLLIMANTLDYLVIGNAELGGILRFSLAIILVLLAQRSSLVVLFAIFVISLAIREPRHIQNVGLLGKIVYSMLSLGVLFWISRYQQIREGLSLAITHWIESFEKTENNQQAVLPLRDHLIATLWLLLLGALFVLLATGLLHNQPFTINGRSWFPWSVENRQVLWPGPTLIALMIGFLVVINEIFWRRKSPRQFRMILKSTYVKLQYSELSSMVRGKLRYMQKQKNLSQTNKTKKQKSK